MKVIYKKNILEKVNEARHEAAVLGKTIEKIILNRDEKRELGGMVSNPFSLGATTLLGIPVEFE